MSFNINQFYCNLPRAEQQRVNTLEVFDEYEGWHLKCSHYTMVCAFQGLCTKLAKDMLSSQGIGVVCELGRDLDKELEPFQLSLQEASASKLISR